MVGAYALASIRLYVVAICLSIAILPTLVLAEVIVDGTVKTPRVIPTNLTRIGGEYAITDDLGSISGKNLFHSFSKFNIGTGETATFSGPANIVNIISRVTGGQSWIDGIIRSTIFGANLYLMNPTGVIFGPNATLDITGSFHITTADYLKFTNGDRFYADPGNASTVLSTAPVSAFGFLGSRPASISFTDNILQVPDGQTFSVIGGDIDFGVSDPVFGACWILAPRGQINIASVASPGEVVTNQSGALPSLDISSFSKLGRISLKNTSMDVTDLSGASGPGTILVRAGKLTIDASYLTAATTGAVKGNDIGIDIDVRGEATITNASQVLAVTVGEGDASAIHIKAITLTVEDLSVVNTSSIDEGWGLPTGGRGGDIVVAANDLNLLRGGEISSNTLTAGNGGNITITAKNLTISSGQATIDADVEYPRSSNIGAQTWAEGRGGNIRVTANNLRILDAGTISADVFGAGPGGDIEINAKNMTISDLLMQSATGIDYHSRIEARVVGETAMGTGGNISVQGDTIALGAGGYIGTYLAYGSPGTAGNITVQAGTLTLNPQGKIESSSVLGTGTGARAGDIAVNANNIIMTGVAPGSTERINFTGMRSDTLDGTGGDITVKAGALAMLNGARIMSDSSGAGTGGDIGITSATVQFDAGAVISAKSTASGYTGNITINTGILESHGSTISAQAAMTDGGNITVNAGGLVLLRDASQITTSVNGGPETTGGNINITSPYVVLDDSNVVANAYEGRGGNIRIVAGVFLASPGSVVSASSRLGIDGSVDIRAPVTDISGTLVPVNGGFLQTAETVRDRCVARIKGSSQSSLTVRGRDGLPPRPGMVLPAPAF